MFDQEISLTSVHREFVTQGQKLKVPDVPEDVPQLSSLSGVEDSSEGEVPSWESSDDGVTLSPSGPPADDGILTGADHLQISVINGTASKNGSISSTDRAACGMPIMSAL